MGLFILTRFLFLLVCISLFSFSRYGITLMNHEMFLSGVFLARNLYPNTSNSLFPISFHFSSYNTRYSETHCYLQIFLIFSRFIFPSNSKFFLTFNSLFFRTSHISFQFNHSRLSFFVKSAFFFSPDYPNYVLFVCPLFLQQLITFIHLFLVLAFLFL